MTTTIKAAFGACRRLAAQAALAEDRPRARRG
jgi:hypothetical protein